MPNTGNDEGNERCVRPAQRIKKIAVLARIINLDEDLLICDLAECYHIYNYKEQSPSYIATLTMGLREDSRTKMALSNQKVDSKMMLLAGILDNTALMLWMNTKDARNGTNKPKSILKAMLNEKQSENKTFSSGSDFLEAFNKIAKG